MTDEPLVFKAKYKWVEVGVEFVPVYEPTPDGADVVLMFDIKPYTKRGDDLG